jgi:HEPN superfamily AbiU2-like protein
MQNSKLTSEDIRAFRSECIHARAVFVHFKYLFESGKNLNFTSMAPIFFGDVCRSFKLYLFVEVCKLTDPAGTAKRNENLSTEFLMASIQEEVILDQLRPLSGRLQEFRKQVKPARDKLASHMDLATTRRQEPVGAVDNQTWNRFWLDLDRFVYILSCHYLEEQVHINAVSNQSDVPALMAALQPCV